MIKFGRNYELQIKTVNDTIITVRLPFTIEFDITRNTLTSANVCQVRIYNLSELRRNQIRKNVLDYGQFLSIQLLAGYGDNLQTIFKGTVTQAWSVREGNNFITQIECFSGGFAFANGTVEKQYAAGTPQKVVIADVAKSLPGVQVGAIGDYPGTLQRSNSYSGSPVNILNELSGGGMFIDNDVVNVLGTSEYIITPRTLVINTDTGLLGTPVLEYTTVRFDMLFEPALNVGTKIRLESQTESNFNGEYKVTAVKHRGMISGAVAGAVITTGEFLFEKFLVGVQSNGT